MHTALSARWRQVRSSLLGNETAKHGWERVVGNLSNKVVSFLAWSFRQSNSKTASGNEGIP